MLWISNSYLLGLFLFGETLGQRDSGAFSSIGGLASGLYGLRKLIDSAVIDSKSGKMERESYPLSPPRHDYGITSEDIKYYLKHSMLAVCKPAEVAASTCFCKGKFENAKVFRNDTLDSQAVVAVDPLNRLIVVSYRLTVSTRNFGTDYDTVLVNYPTNNGKEKVHRGNLEFFNSLHPQMKLTVLELLKDPKHKDYKLHLTGYSLGGAVTAISLPAWQTALIDNNLRNKIQAYTYSGTRPGNIEYAKHLEGLGVPIVRYAKRGDGVTLIPDQSLGYSQVGHEFFDDSLYTKNKTLIKCSSNVVEDNTCALSATRFLAMHHLTPFQKPLPLPPFC